MSLLVKAEAVTLLSAIESSLGVQPTSGWVTLQPNPDGIEDFYAHISTVQPKPLSKLRQLERPEVVDLDAMPKITHDWTKDLSDAFAEGMFLAKSKWPGGTGLGQWQPIARTSGAYTLPGGTTTGAVQQGTLLFARGFANAANNGLVVAGAGSTATSVAVAGGIAETPSGYPVLLEVAGFRGTAGDIGIDVNGNITSTTADFTTMGIVPGMMIWVGGTVGGGHDFIVQGSYRGFVKVVTVAAHLLTLERRSWTVGSADPGTGQTIDLYFPHWLRNVAFDSTDYAEISYGLELSMPGLGSGAATEYVYAAGNVINQVEITSPAQNIVTAMITFQGTTIGDPTITRATGAASPKGLLAVDRLTSVAKEKYLAVLDQVTGAVVSSDIDNWKITFMNNVTPQKQQGYLGAKRDIVGKAQVELEIEAYLTQDEGMKACRANSPLVFGAGFRNGDGGVFFDVPSMTFNDAPTKFPENGAVTMSVKAGGYRDAFGNYTMAMSLFAYLPNG